jgi:hypothetical protein
LRDYAKKNISFENDIVFPQTILEDHFVGACTCYVWLRDRDEKYHSIFDSASPGEIMSDVLLKQLHIYEYFFFCCCGYIYKELLHEIKMCGLIIPKDLLDKLSILNQERRVREHGKDWYWGDGGQIVPTRGDNYNFENNMKLLDQIYNEILMQLGILS